MKEKELHTTCAIDVELPLYLDSDHISNLVYQNLVQTALDLSTIRLNGTEIKIPYWMNNCSLYADTPLYKTVKSGGKFSKDELINKAFEKAREHNFDLTKDPEMSHLFMFMNGLGVDCSGFVYQSLENAYNLLGGEGEFRTYMKDIFGENGGTTRTAARHIASQENAFRIFKIQNIKPADVILCEKGRHILIIAGKSDEAIFAFHTTNVTQTTGVHPVKINIVNENMCIFDQDWEEKLHNRKPYGKHLKSTKGENDGIWRIKIIDDLYNQNNSPGSSLTST